MRKGQYDFGRIRRSPTCFVVDAATNSMRRLISDFRGIGTLEAVETLRVCSGSDLGVFHTYSVTFSRSTWLISTKTTTIFTRDT